jgi:hypothetical protein
MHADRPIQTKTQMYALLSAGAFGNTVPQYFSVDTWLKSEDVARYPMWGLRSLTVGGPCRLYCPTGEVADTGRLMGANVNISPMIDAVSTILLWADVYDSPTGLIVYGIERPPHGASWRGWMPSKGREFRGIAAHQMLRRYLNPNSLADLQAVFERWPGHVVELSACDRCIGVVPGRNAVIWECRSY